MKNPIIDNRIVNDKTFAIRLRSFIERTNVCDAISEEEKDYLLRIANNLFSYQKETAYDKTEIDYLNRVN